MSFNAACALNQHGASSVSNNLSDLNNLFISVERFLADNNISITGQCTAKLRKQDEGGNVGDTFVLEVEVVSMRHSAIDETDGTDATSPNRIWQMRSGTSCSASDVQPSALVATNEHDTFQPSRASFSDAAISDNPLGDISLCLANYHWDEAFSTDASDVASSDISCADLDNLFLGLRRRGVGDASPGDVNSSTTVLLQPDSTIRESLPPSPHSLNHYYGDKAYGNFSSQLHILHTADAITHNRRARHLHSCSAPEQGIYLQRRLRQSKTEQHIKRATRSVLRPDYLEFLETELPRWSKWGLWEHLSDINTYADSTDAYYSLQVAYATVCILEARVNDDAIRSRIALIELHREYVRACEARSAVEDKRGVGCGVSSCIIDQILQRIHHDWTELNETQRKTRRTQFHDRKRYGKRWAILADGLEKGIIILSSPIVAKIVRNTTFTSTMLDTFVKSVHANDKIMSILSEIKDLAEQLYYGGRFDSSSVSALLTNVRKEGWN